MAIRTDGNQLRVQAPVEAEAPFALARLRARGLVEMVLRPDGQLGVMITPAGIAAARAADEADKKAGHDDADNPTA